MQQHIYITDFCKKCNTENPIHVHSFEDFEFVEMNINNYKCCGCGSKNDLEFDINQYKKYFIDSSEIKNINNKNELLNIVKSKNYFKKKHRFTNINVYKRNNIGFNFELNKIKTKFIKTNYETFVKIKNDIDVSIIYNFKTSFDFKYSLEFKLIDNRLFTNDSILNFDYNDAKISLNLISDNSDSVNVVDNDKANELIGICFNIVNDFIEKYSKINNFIISEDENQIIINIFKYIFEHKYKTKFKSNRKEDRNNILNNDYIYSKINII